MERGPDQLFEAWNAEQLNGSYFGNPIQMAAFYRNGFVPDGESTNVGFHVVSVPGPPAFTLVALGTDGFLVWARRRYA